MTRRVLLGVVFVVVGSGCAPTGSSSPPEASAVAETEACPAIDLISPGGEPLDLTGMWLADDFGTYAIRQVGSCVYWLGMSDTDDGDGDQPHDAYPPGRWWTNVFSGRLSSDFLIHGTWADVPQFADGPTDEGTMILEIAFPPGGGDRGPSLIQVDQDRRREYFATVWYPVESVGPLSEFIGTYGFQEGTVDSSLVAHHACPWVEIDGVRMEAVIPLPPYLLSEDGNVLDQRQGPGQGMRLTARPGDPVRVLGRLAPYPGPAGACAANTILVSRIWPAP